MKEEQRGIVKIKPVYVGLHHYTQVYGSVCSSDVEGTPHFPQANVKEIQEAAQRMVRDFKNQVNVDFVEVQEPVVISDHQDMRTLREKISLDTDALLVRSRGAVPLEMNTISNLGFPIARADESFLRGIRARSYLRESKMLYIGEIPSFSAPNGPYDFPLIENTLGVRTRHIETNEFYRYFDGIPEEEVEGELQSWEKEFEEVIEPSRDDLLNATRVYLALRSLADREDANGITVNCGRFTEERPVVPCLAFDRLIDEGIMCACEGDITAMLSSLLLHSVSQRAVTMGNFRVWQGESQVGDVGIEHDIIPLSIASSGFTVRDYHGRKFGVTAYAEIEPGQPMTLMNISTDLGSITALQGRILETEDGIHCREIVRMAADSSSQEIREEMVGSQHVSMTIGHWGEALEEAANLLGMELKMI